MRALERVLLDPSRIKDIALGAMVAASLTFGVYIEIGVWKADAACPDRIGTYCPSASR